MKKSIIILVLISMIPALSFAQKVYQFPGQSDPIFSITIDNNWTVESADGVFTISPSSSMYSDSFVCLMWASDNPNSETAIDDIAEAASMVISTVLEDVTWAEDITDFTNNEITFVGTDGSGYYVSSEGSRTKMVTSILLLIPPTYDDVVAFIFFATEDAYDQYEDSFLNMVLSIK
ncbi:MAG TPA: hypothetical protein PLM49_04480 [Bacteroidales bacterium]|nr:hypothetical protein [Bacteroidales bacterium]